VSHHDVVVIGGGVIGTAIAYNLALQGVKATILERRHDGGHASMASAGMLHPIERPDSPAPFNQLSALSFALFPDLAADIHERTGVDIGLRRSGWLRVALTEADADELRARFHTAEERGQDATWLTAGEALALEPALSPAVLAGMLLPAGSQVYAPALLRGLTQASAALGATVRTGVDVAALLTRSDAVTGVRLSTGEHIEADHVVVAAGAWSARLLADLNVALPVVPVRGQILALHSTPAALHHIVFGADVYLAPKSDGSVVVGATYERVGFDDRLTAEGINFLLLHGTRAAPALANATFRAAWVGLRPGSPDGMPVLGNIAQWQNLTIATGHTAEGVLLSPITGRLMAQRILGEGLDMRIDAFGLDRFVTGTGS
jgi:glycine oxidase